MDVGKIIKSSFRSNQVYSILLDESTAASGPFDGGCLICAKAIIRAMGSGDLVRIASNLNSTEHYGAMVDGEIYDGSGWHESPEAWIKQFIIDESIHDRSLSYAEGHDPESEIHDDPSAEKKIASLLQTNLRGNIIMSHIDEDDTPYAIRVRQLEEDGCTTSDAQGVADVEEMQGTLEDEIEKWNAEHNTKPASRSASPK